MKTFIVVVVIALVLATLWLVINRVRKIFLPQESEDEVDDPGGNEAPETKTVYAKKSSLEDLCRKYGTRSLKGLTLIFEFEKKKILTVYDDTVAQKLQIYDAGRGKQPRWTVLLPFVKDHLGQAFHPTIQFDETLEDNGWHPGHVYPGKEDYRKLYGKKVLFNDLPWDVQIFILIAIEAPIVEEYELGGEQF